MWSRPDRRLRPTRLDRFVMLLESDAAYFCLWWPTQPCLRLSETDLEEELTGPPLAGSSVEPT